jgi:ERCC4-type nuclease
MLPVGDIWIGLSGEEVGAGGLVIERKEANDLEASILDGRYREQRTRLTTYCAQQGARPLYIIEGGLDRLWGKLTEQALQKYLNRLMLRYGVPVIRTDSVADTARICKLLAEQIGAESTVFVASDPTAVAYSSTVAVKKRANKEDPRNFAAAALQGCPGVSAAAAEAILTACGGTLTGVWAATEEALAAVLVGKRRLGPTVAKRLWGILHSG